MAHLVLLEPGLLKQLGRSLLVLSLGGLSLVQLESGPFEQLCGRHPGLGGGTRAPVNGCAGGEGSVPDSRGAVQVAGVQW